MNKKHLGDAYDYWKGSLISILTKKHKIISNLAVVPMRTDNRWSERRSRRYKNLLNLHKKNSVYHKDKFKNPQVLRHKYFASIPVDCDLFLDPDIGICAGEHTKEKHITIADISCLLCDHNNGKRVLMVYQHSRRDKKWVSKTQREIKKQISGISCYPHECGQVAMFFVSWNKKRIENIRKALTPYTAAKKRIWPK